MFEGSLGIVLAVSSLSGACLGLSQAVLEATRRFWTTVSRFQAILGISLGARTRFWTTVSRFQAILVITLGARTRFWTTVSRFQAILGTILGRRNKGPPPQSNRFWDPWGRLRGGIPKGYRRNPTALTPLLRGGAGGYIIQRLQKSILFYMLSSKSKNLMFFVLFEKRIELGD